MTRPRILALDILHFRRTLEKWLAISRGNPERVNCYRLHTVRRRSRARKLRAAWLQAWDAAVAEPE